MSKYINVTEVGTYSLMALTIGLLIFVAGLEFYNFNSREIISKSQDELPLLITSQMVLHGLTYLIVLPGSLAVFAFLNLPWLFAPWFVALLVLEHLSQEATRLFTTIGRPNLANVILFIRSASWIYVLVPLMHLSPELRTISSIWVAWTAGGIVSLLVAWYGLRSLNWNAVRSNPIDWLWIKSGLLVCVPFIGASIAQRLTETSDRYILNWFHGDSALGVYTLYSGLASSIQSLVYAGIIMSAYPKIISLSQSENQDEYLRLLKAVTKRCVIASLALAAIAAIAIFPILLFINKSIYWHGVSSYWLLLISSCFASLAFIPGLMLYSAKLDRVLLGCRLASLLVAVIVGCYLIKEWGLVGAGVTNVVAMVTLFGLNSSFALRFYYKGNCGENPIK